MPTAFCERADVRQALQKSTAKFGDKQLADEFVDAAINGVSQWFKNASKGYWYDSGGGTDLVDTSATTRTGIRASLPSSPHRQPRHGFKESRSGLVYPNPQDGIYCRTRLPARWVESIDALDVMDNDGGVNDWVADSDKVEGRGDDYYLTVDGSRGRSYLYVAADELPHRTSFEDILTVDITYGLDYQTEPWDDVKRGVAALAAAQVVTDDDVIAQLPDQGQLIGVETQVQQLVAQGIESQAAEGIAALRPYLDVAVV